MSSRLLFSLYFTSVKVMWVCRTFTWKETVAGGNVFLDWSRRLGKHILLVEALTEWYLCFSSEWQSICFCMGVDKVDALISGELGPGDFCKVNDLMQLTGLPYTDNFWPVDNVNSIRLSCVKLGQNESFDESYLCLGFHFIGMDIINLVYLYNWKELDLCALTVDGHLHWVVDIAAIPHIMHAWRGKLPF